MKLFSTLLILTILFSCAAKRNISYYAGRTHIDTIWDKSGCVPLYAVQTSGLQTYNVEIDEKGRIVIKDSDQCVTGYIDRDVWNRVKDEYDTTPTTVITIVGGRDGDGRTKGAAVFNPGFIEDSGIIEINYGGESGFIMHQQQRDTIMTSDLDLSVTYSDTKKNFIIYGGEVFFRSDVVGEEKRAKEVLDRFKEMQDRANEKLNQQYLKSER
jgi:hypothetical protein